MTFMERLSGMRSYAAGAWRTSSLRNFICGSYAVGWFVEEGGGNAAASYGNSIFGRLFAAVFNFFVRLLHRLGDFVAPVVEGSSILGACGRMLKNCIPVRLLRLWRELPAPVVPEMYPVMGYVVFDWAIRQSPFSFLSGVWDELAFVLIVGCWLLRVMLLRVKPNFRQWIVPVALYAAVMIFLALYNSPDNTVAIEGLRVMIEYVFWIFVGANMMFSRTQLAWLIDFLILCTAIVALYGIYQYFVGVEIPAAWIDSKVETSLKTRVFSIIGSPNILGAIMVLVLPATYAMFLQAKGRLRKYLYLGAVIIMGVCLVFTFSRGAWLAFIFAAVLTGLWVDKRILAVLLLLIVISPILLPSVADRMSYMMSSDYKASSQSGGRIGRWSHALAYWQEQPATGVGLGRFGGAVAARFYPNDSFYVDSWYLKVGTESGWIGLGATLLFLITMLRKARSALDATESADVKRIGFALLAGVCGVLAHNLVENVFEVPMMATYCWLFIGIILAMPSFGKDVADETS